MDKAARGAYIQPRRRRMRPWAVPAALPLDRTTIAAQAALQLDGAVGIIVPHFFRPSRMQVGSGPGDRSRGGETRGQDTPRLIAQLFDIVDCKEGMRGRRSPGAGFGWLPFRLRCNRVS